VSVLAAVVLLALPIRALGAVTLAGQATPGGVPAGLAPGSTYVVQAGDTIASLAKRINAGDAAQLERSLIAEVGSSTLVPGERVVVP
jgi:LysM repeat protein